MVDKLFNGIGEYDVYKNYIDNRENKYWFDKLENEYNLLKNYFGFSDDDILQFNLNAIDAAFILCI